VNLTLLEVSSFIADTILKNLNSSMAATKVLTLAVELRLLDSALTSNRRDVAQRFTL
jgi:hypothetical protein